MLQGALCAAQEEVFENERFQPFRGWGHLWPGHFLPSDKVGHWSDRQVGAAQLLQHGSAAVHVSA
jgi:hypothetical protein